MKGLVLALKEEWHIWLVLVFYLPATVVNIVLRLPLSHFLMIEGVISIVLICELFNSALERLTDLVSPGYHKIAGQVKDIAGAAVLVSIFLAIATALIIYIAAIIRLIQQ